MVEDDICLQLWALWQHHILSNVPAWVALLSLSRHDLVLIKVPGSLWLVLIELCILDSSF